MTNNHRRIFVMRHASYKRVPEELTPMGELQAKGAADVFRENGAVSEGLVIINSTAPRARQTAAFIADSLGLSTHESAELNKKGNFPYGMGTFEALLDVVLEQAGVEGSNSNLALITHAPLVAAVAGYETSEANGVPYCRPYVYEPETWRQPDEI